MRTRRHARLNRITRDLLKRTHSQGTGTKRGALLFESLEDRRLLTANLALDPTPPLDENSSLSLTGLVSGLAPGNNFTLDINWGDGGPVQQIVDSADGSGNKAFSVPHVYADDGSYAISVALVESPLIVGADAVFVIDVSGSTQNNFAGSSVGNQNPGVDVFSDRILDAEIAAYKALNQELINRGLGNISKVSLVAFEETAWRPDMEPGTAGFQSFTTPLADTDNNGVRDVDQALMSLGSSGFTNYEAALQQAILAIQAAGTAPGAGNVVFLSDGLPNRPNTSYSTFADEVANIKNTLGQNLRAFGVGSSVGLSALQTLDPGASVFSNTNQLLDIFSGSGQSGGDTAVASTVVTVNDVAPGSLVLTLSSTSIDENLAVTLTGSFEDPGTLDTFTLDIDWGDPLSPGNIEFIDLTNPPAHVTWDGNTRTFTVTHQYLDDNPSNTASDTYTIGVTVTDDDTLAGSASTVVQVGNVPASISAFGTDSSCCGGAAENETVTATLSFSDPGTLDTHTVTISWGDGLSETIQLTNGERVVQPTHAYAAGGVYQVSVTLGDDDSGYDSTSTTVVVSGVGIVGDTLYVVGTEGDDQVTVNQTGGGVLKVHASFLSNPDEPRKVVPTGVEQIVVILCDGNDRATISGSLKLPSLIDGGDGDDELNGGGGGSVLLGGGGNDRLLGGSLRDILIGGTGEDRLLGNPGEDILVGGSTTFDSDPEAPCLPDEDALFEFLEEWNGTSSRPDREQAWNDLVQAILADGEQDKLTGASGEDWFLADDEDVITDLRSNGKGRGR